MDAIFSGYLQTVNHCLQPGLSPSDADVCKTYLQAVGSIAQAFGAIVAALVIGIAGGSITLFYNLYRAKQDRESQWRQHAIDLTKLDLDRRIRSRAVTDAVPLRPGILDFLANYRDLTQLGEFSPAKLYGKIQTERTTSQSQRVYNVTWLQLAMELAKTSDELNSNDAEVKTELTRLEKFLRYYIHLDTLGARSAEELLAAIQEDGQQHSQANHEHSPLNAILSRLKKLR